MPTNDWERARRRSRRIERRQSFDHFFKRSRDLFERISEEDPRNDFFEQVYSLCIVPGGAQGGHDSRTIEIFYGRRPFDSVNEISMGNGSLPSMRKRLISEIGARLMYQRVDNGTVICTLEPARSENFNRKETAIELQWIKDPNALIFREVIQQHWNYFVSYMEYTSLEGEPTIIDKLRVWWLLFSKSLVVDKELRTPVCWRLLGDIAKWVITVGFSGLLVFSIQQKYFSSPAPAASCTVLASLQEHQPPLPAPQCR